MGASVGDVQPRSGSVCGTPMMTAPLGKESFFGSICHGWDWASLPHPSPAQERCQFLKLSSAFRLVKSRGSGRMGQKFSDPSQRYILRSPWRRKGRKRLSPWGEVGPERRREPALNFRESVLGPSEDILIQGVGRPGCCQ